MPDFEYQTIPILALRLDTSNPRHEAQADELAEIKEFLGQQGSKIVRLIKDIATSGTNPAELLIVIPEDQDPQKFIVLEGNRRLLSPLFSYLSQVLTGCGRKQPGSGMLACYMASEAESTMKSIRSD